MIISGSSKYLHLFSIEIQTNVKINTKLDLHGRIATYTLTHQLSTSTGSLEASHVSKQERYVP